MLRRFLFPVFLLFLSSVSFAQITGTTWGPDAFGYRADTASFAWVDIISRPGVALVTGMGDDDSKGPFQIGFPFHYYWSDYQTVRIGSNGWVGFANTSNIASCFPTIPTQGGAGDNYLAPFMSDLNPANPPNPGTIHYWSNFFDSFVVTYTNMPFWVLSPTSQVGSNTFQVVLNRFDSSIRFQYLSMSGSWPQSCASDVVIGWENVTGAIGQMIAVEQNPLPATAIRIRRPNIVTFNVPDATPLWVGNSDNGGKFYKVGPLPMLEANIKNVGNTAITNTITVTGSILNSSNATVWTETQQLFSGLLSGSDQNVFFTTAPTINIVGTYTFRVAISNSQDLNASNNINSIELNMVQAIGDSIRLSYASQNNPTANQSWSGGALDDGIGVYYEPPYYPAKITSVQAYVRGTSAGDDWWIKVHSDAGTPGVLLDSVKVNAFTFTSESWVKVQLTNPVIINSGGFYVSWIQGGAINSLGSETTLPISRRSFEILNDQWAEFRNNTTIDVLLNVWIESDVLTGIVDLDTDQFVSVFPNPTTGLVTIRGIGCNGCYHPFRLTDLSGKSIEVSANQKEDALLLDVSRLNNGIYLIHLNQKVIKLVKE